MSPSNNKSIEQRLGSLENQVRKLFNLTRSVVDQQNIINNHITGPTQIQLTHAHEWRKARERIHPCRESQYGAQYYRPNDLDEILAEYLLSQSL